jgi:DNA-binding FadR family transcriptional regulator
MARTEGKRAEQVAAQIEADIAALGWPVGKNLGSEASLIEKYGVSRAVLREAIRLIEHHLVGRMRPGPGGGLVVTEQNPEGVARAMSLYLAFAKVGRDQLLVVRGEIEGIAAELAATVATEQERVQLQEFMRSEAESIGQSWREAKEFHLRVANMAHNPAIYLFVRCLVDLTEQHTEPSENRMETAQRIHDVHMKIADAVIGGDSGLARYRMRRHISAISPFLAEAITNNAPGADQPA